MMFIDIVLYRLETEIFHSLFRVRLSTIITVSFPLFIPQNADFRIVKLSDVFFPATFYLLDEMNFNSIKLSTWMRNQKLHLTVTMLTKIPCEMNAKRQVEVQL